MRLAQIRTVAALLAPQRWRVLAIAVLCGVQAASLIPVTVLIARIFETDIPRHRTGAILLSGVEIIALYLVWITVSLAVQWLVLAVAGTAAARLRVGMIDHVYRMPDLWHSHQDVGVLHATVVDDGLRVEYLLIAALLSAAALSVTAPLIVLAAVLAPLLALLLLVIVPLLLYVHRRFGQAVSRRAELWRTGAIDYSARLGRALRTLRAARIRAADLSERQARLDELRHASETMRGRNWLQVVSSTTQGGITALTGLIVLVVGGAAVAAGWLTLGHLAAFYAVLGLALRQGMTASGQGATVLDNLPSLDAVLALLADAAQAPYAGTRRLRFDGSVELTGVHFAYADRPVLDGAGLTIAAGESVALIGPNGAGKSSLAALLLGLHAPTAGTIRMGGHDIAELDLVHLRSQIGVVEQEAVLFPTSLRANIAWGRPEATDADILRACEQAGAADIRGLGVLDTEVHVGEDGVRLSGGQRQRIAVARALLGCPRMLILDEPTNHLDLDAVATLMASLRNLDPAPTVLLITHDRALAAHAERQIALRSGTTVELDPAEMAALLR